MTALWSAGARPPKRSYERLNYGLRPAKHIERKMLVEAFRRLSPFRSLPSYRYLGLGSVYFVDFALVHRDLGIRDMVSVEDEPDQMIQKRFWFNRPFRSIRMRFGSTTRELPQVDWTIPTIGWLDYDGKIKSGILTDVATFAAKTVTGGLLAVSVNCEYDEPRGKRSKPALETFRNRLPLGKTPSSLTEAALQGWGTAEAIRQIIKNEIVDTLATRNGVLAAPEKVEFEQILNFRYQDSARMVTVGFVFFRSADRQKFDQGEWAKLPFYRSNSDSYLIQAPALTFRELRYLEHQLPFEKHQLRGAGLTAEVLEQYERVYRYYPNFAETIV